MITPIITVIVALIVGALLLRGRSLADYVPGLAFAVLGLGVSLLNGAPVWVDTGADAIDIAVGSWIAYCIGRGGR